MKVANNGLKIVVGGALGHFPEKFVVSALEKQIPKKPMGIYDENDHRIKDDDSLYEPALFGVCSVCNKEVQDGMIYCSFCGQALDWG